MAYTIDKVASEILAALPALHRSFNAAPSTCKRASYVENDGVELRAKIANILQNVSDTPISEFAQRRQYRDDPTSQTSPQQMAQPLSNAAMQPQQMQQRQPPSDMSQLAGALDRHSDRTQEYQRNRIRLQREQDARSLAQPLGAYLGGRAGNLVSSLAGRKSRGGLLGMLGFEEDRINPESASEIGQLIGRAGLGEVAANLAGRIPADSAF